MQSNSVFCHPVSLTEFIAMLVFSVTFQSISVIKLLIIVSHRMATCISQTEYQRTTNIIDLGDFICTYPKSYDLSITDFQQRYQESAVTQAREVLAVFRKHLFRANMRQIKLFLVRIDEYSFVMKLPDFFWEKTLVKIDGEIY
jgi:hypothetical protein